MTNYSPTMMAAIMVVSFIAGYAVVSYVVRKLKEGKTATKPDDHDENESMK